MTIEIWPTSALLKTLIIGLLVPLPLSLWFWTDPPSSAKPDALLRWVDHKRREEDNQNQFLLGPELFRIHATFHRPTTEAQMIPGEGNIFLEWIQNCINRDEKIVKGHKELGISRNLQGEEWLEENRFILYHGKVYVPLDSMLRVDIVRAYHDSSYRSPWSLENNGTCIP